MKKENPKDKTTMTAREVAVLIEDLRSQFRTFGEKLSALDDKLDGVMGMTAKNVEDIALLNIKADVAKAEINKLNGKLTKIEDDVRVIKADTAEIKDLLKSHDSRIAHLEAVK